MIPMAPLQDNPYEALAHWQELRAAGLSPEERLSVLMRDFFAPPPPSDFEYELTLRDVASAMEVA